MEFDINEAIVKSRTIYLTSEVSSETARTVIAYLMYMDSLNHEEIKLYVNSPGGSVSDGLAIIDTMKLVKSPVHTIGIGLAASMGALILAAGDKRSATEHTMVLIHQPLIGGQGVTGQATDIIITAERMKRTKETTSRLLSKYTGQPIERIAQDCERDYWMTAQEAKEYGLIDNVLLTE